MCLYGLALYTVGEIIEWYSAREEAVRAVITDEPGFAGIRTSAARRSILGGVGPSSPSAAETHDNTYPRAACEARADRPGLADDDPPPYRAMVSPSHSTEGAVPVP